jgi:malonyl CoA-acyl carrier protein transacylase
MKAYMFPGQGAQRIGMGAGLFEAYPKLVAKADAVLGYSVRDLCLQGPIERLTQTEFTQPALFVVNALAYLRKVQEAGTPDYLLGHSVSEYVALFGAGVIDFETGLRLVRKRVAAWPRSWAWMRRRCRRCCRSMGWLTCMPPTSIRRSRSCCRGCVLRWRKLNR